MRNEVWIKSKLTDEEFKAKETALVMGGDFVAGLLEDYDQILSYTPMEIADKLTIMPETAEIIQDMIREDKVRTVETA